MAQQIQLSRQEESFEKQIIDGGPVTVTDKNIIRYFMTIEEACQLVIQASEMTLGGDLFVLDMGYFVLSVVHAAMCVCLYIYIYIYTVVLAVKCCLAVLSLVWVSYR